jgi:hypothetical protein|tara:strand:- start:380 stop:559 length:180 start_codon:yes stop_codon:yes gene_type:complete
MTDEKEKEINNFAGSNCVIRDDDHGWGGPDPYEIEPVEKKKKEKTPIDEPVNWPFNRFR